MSSTSPYAHGAAVSVVHSGQKMEVSDSWPYLATPRVVPMLSPSSPTAPPPPPPLRNRAMLDGSYVEDSAIADSIHNVSNTAVPMRAVVSQGGPTQSGNPLLSGDVSKLILFAAVACGVVLLLDISAKTFISTIKK